MLKDILQDLVSHTHVLGFLPLVKVTGSNVDKAIMSMAEDRSVILFAKTHQNVPEFDAVFGMPNLDKLNLHLKNPEYRDDADIQVVKAERNGVEIPVGLHFQNAAGDFQNDYRFMSEAVINEKFKSIDFKGAKWAVEFTPSVSAIARMKLQAVANSDEQVFQVKVESGNLVFSFGDLNTHAGSFVFQPDVQGRFSHVWSWPVSQVLSILGLAGDLIMKISDQGVMQITVDSGLMAYDYYLPAMVK